MKILNLNAHILNFDDYNNNKFRNNEKLNEFQSNIKFENDSDGDMLSFKFSHCDDFYKDYKSNGEKICDLNLVGTKNEIISYIYKEYNKLNMQFNNSQNKIENLDSNIKNKEEDFLKVQGNEKKERNKIESDLKTIKCKKQDLSDFLKKEKEKSSKLNSKIIDLEMKLEKLTEEEINIILNQLENEKQSKKDLELKFSELQVRSAEKSKN